MAKHILYILNGNTHTLHPSYKALHRQFGMDEMQAIDYVMRKDMPHDARLLGIFDGSKRVTLATIQDDKEKKKGWFRNVLDKYL